MFGGFSLQKCDDQINSPDLTNKKALSENSDEFSQSNTAPAADAETQADNNGLVPTLQSHLSDQQSVPSFSNNSSAKKNSRNNVVNGVQPQSSNSGGTSTQFGSNKKPQQQQPQQQQAAPATLSVQAQKEDNELNSMVSAFASPISEKIYMAFDTKQKHMQKQQKKFQNRQQQQNSSNNNQHSGDSAILTTNHRNSICVDTQTSPLDGGGSNNGEDVNKELKGAVYREFTIHIFQSISFLQALQIDEEDIRSRSLTIEWKKPPHIRKLLIFDLDETLAHCVRHKNPLKTPDVFLEVPTPSGKVLNAGFNVRPYTHEILEYANKNFEVCVFTASNQSYADTFLNWLDPEGVLIQHRFYREQCIKTPDNIYVKDLRIFRNVPLSQILIVDNAVYSFSAQLDNGIPITPFKEDPDDVEFQHLIKHLQKCAKLTDMRECNKSVFRFGELMKYDFEQFIDQYDYEECEKLIEEDEEEMEMYLRQQSQLQHQRMRQSQQRSGGTHDDDSSPKNESSDEDEDEEEVAMHSSTGSDTQKNSRKRYQVTNLGKTVTDALDQLSMFMKRNGGKLPTNATGSTVGQSEN